MPKVQKSKLHSHVLEFKDTFSSDGGVLFCKLYCFVFTLGPEDTED